MSAVWVRAIKELRARWRPWLAIALMIGIAGGVVMAAAAGARRSDTAVPRFLAYSQASTADVEADPSQFHAIAALPQVESASAAAFLLMGKSLAKSVDTRFAITVLALADPTLQSRAMVSSGRLFNMSDPGEALINDTALRTGALKIGETVNLRGFTFEQLQDVLRGSTADPKGPTATVKIVGSIRQATDLSTTRPPPGILYTGNDVLLLTPALYERIGHETANFLSVAVRLKHADKDLQAFTKEVARLTAGKGVVHGGSDEVQAGIEAQRATHTEAVALWLFAALAGVAALLVIGQSLSRQIFAEAGDNETLLALGMSRAQLLMSAFFVALIAGLVGAVVGVATAILLSPLAPLGLARQADVDVGFHIDLPVVLIGAAGCIVLVAGRALFPAMLASRLGGEREGSRKPSRVADALARAGMSASSVAGVQMALDPGRGGGAVPVRAAIAGSVVAITVLITALAFGAGLTHLADTPRLQGWTWDFALGNPHSDDVSARAIPLLRGKSFIAGISAEAFGTVVLGKRDQTIALGLDRVSGDVGPPILEGRAPRGSDEVALGTKALRTLKKHVGDTVQIGVPEPGHDRSMRIVGRVLITPVIVNGQSTLGDGALMSMEALRLFVPPQQSDQGAVNVFLVKLAPGVDRAAAFAALKSDFPGTVLTPYPPAEVENLRRIDTLPFVLAGLLGLLAIATIAHTLITSVRRRRRDLAILKTIGFERRQVSATVAWQASTLGALAGAIGLVAGVIVGRALWTFFAGRLGIHPEPVLPVLLLVAIVPGALLLANLIAAIPARAAARTEPALILRTE